ADRSRRPLRSPGQTAEAIEAAVVELRQRHPAWGGRKLRRRLLDLGHSEVPAASTINGILRRHGLIDEAEAA
ncbi:MAG: IS481 family transposase, partial [Gammaproteobacteria bacterium]|nr:IS481 family transposase [Gammaproteobacteria bacterium]NIT63754.1 IS481 family transposase [Gammaproteobacteria bacterium]NIV20700.1 IS481 family transposase [Gammaproteobacteria bacterium]NIY32334.1 IS481 family transposase [Gammaproteobacteria bacterium]